MSARDPIPSDWHWPSFEPSICGMFDDRERLGLPHHFVSLRFDKKLPIEYAKLRGFGTDKLLDLLNLPQSELSQRIVAGNLLALIGDPRILDYQHVMIDIPGGDIKVGLDFQDVREVLSDFEGLGLQSKWIEKECPRHAVKLNDYKIAKYPVTNSQYKAFLLDTRHPEIPTSWEFRRYPFERANHPVYTISPESADAYATWIRLKTGIPYRLPTEAEWEWAAAGPENLEFPWGNKFNADLANTAETGLLSSSAVGAFLGGDSYYGVSDMAGNVEEYVSSNYTPYPNGQLITDHLVELNGNYRVARGGSFARFRDLARTKRRHGHNPRSATYAMGFRLACDM